MLYTSAVVASGVLLAFGLYLLASRVYKVYTSPLRYLPGPKSDSYFWGNIKAIWKADNSVLQEKWIAEYGPTIKYTGLFYESRLYTMDTKALNHILMNTAVYEKPEASRWSLSRIVGPGLLVVEGDKHKQQRKIMNPAFGAAQIRELTEIFVEKSIELRDAWSAECSKEGTGGSVDALSWLSRMTLDVIGVAGFNYNFNALKTSGETNELNKAFSVIFHAGTRVSALPIIQAWFPILRYLPSLDKKEADIQQAHNTMSRIGKQLLNQTKTTLYGTGEKDSNWRARDLLSLLIRANMSTDIAGGHQMTDEDVLAQVPTFLVAGHETTSTGTTWALFALTQDKEVQTKLREELLTVSTDNPTMDELNSLTYLDYVVRETLRIHAPVPSTIRTAVKDDILPLNTPYTDTRGDVHDTVRVTKGQTLLIPILAINRDKSIWGEDAMEFKPERWASVPEAAGSIPGVWGNMLTFLGGPRACIGYRFSLVEMKALLFTLVRAFEFELAVPAEDIIKKSTIVQRPLLRTDPEGGNQLPLIIRPYQRI